IQARRSARGTERYRRGRYDGVRGKGFRPPEGSDRNLSRGRIFHQHAAQGEAGNRSHRRARTASRRDDPAGGQHRFDRRWQDLRAGSHIHNPHPHRRNRGLCAVSGVDTQGGMNMIRKLVYGAGTLGASMFAASAAWAQDAAGEAAAAVSPQVAEAVEGAVALDTGDTTWMMISAVLVLAMFLPGLALFYGGLVRTKNMLSVLTQVLTVA